MPVEEELQLAGEQEAEVPGCHLVLQGGEEGVEEGVQVGEVATLRVE